MSGVGIVMKKRKGERLKDTRKRLKTHGECYETSKMKIVPAKLSPETKVSGAGYRYNILGYKGLFP